MIPPIGDAGPCALDVWGGFKSGPPPALRKGQDDSELAQEEPAAR